MQGGVVNWFVPLAPTPAKVGIWGAEVAALAPGILAPFGSAPALATEVVSGVSLRPAGVLLGPVVRARAWAEPCARLCAHLVVVNFDQSSPAEFAVSVRGLPPVRTIPR